MPDVSGVGTISQFAFQVNNMNFVAQPNSKHNHSFLIRSTDPNKPTNEFYCVAASEDEAISWRIHFEMVLESQKLIMEALQFPINYQNELKKQKSVDDAVRKPEKEKLSKAKLKELEKASKAKNKDKK